MNMLNSNCKISFVKPEFLTKALRENPRLYDIGCYNDNLALMLAPESDETIRLAHESRSKLSDSIKPFDYKNLINLYDLFVPQREKSHEQRYFSERSKMSHTLVKNENSKESFNKQTTLLEERMDESILWDQKLRVRDSSPYSNAYRKHFKTLSLDESRSPDFDLFSDQEEYSEEEVAETMVETMEQYMSKSRADYGSGVPRPKIEDKDNFDLKG
ncbi:hypothetical protein Tco_1374328 [Tanacetum coccineum]